MAHEYKYLSTELDQAKWQLKFCLRRAKCYLSGKTILLEYAYYAKVTSRYAVDALGTPTVTEYWATKEEWLINQLKKG